MSSSNFLGIYFIFFQVACQHGSVPPRQWAVIIGEGDYPQPKLYESVILFALVKGHYQFILNNLASNSFCLFVFFMVGALQTK
jgi:hypothetical protein